MCGSTPLGKRTGRRSAEILPCGVDKTGFRCKYSAFFPHRKQAKIKKSERVRISAHILRGDVKFFPCASAVGVNPSAKGASKTQERFLERWVFLGKVEGKSEKPRAFRMDWAEGRTDVAQALRRMAADELTGVYEGRALWALTDEGAR